MLRCIAIDDEELALELLEDNIRKVPFLELAGTFNNPLAAMQFLQQEAIDLVFIDIQMPGLTGLQFIDTAVHKPMFILITAYEQYALESYNLDVVDYLLKPVSLDRFIKACNRAQELHQLRNRPAEAPAKEVDYFFINVDYSLVKVLYADVVWVEGLKDYVKIHLKSTTRPLVARLSMKAIEDLLPPAQFIRIHRSYIVSKGAVTAVRKNSIFLEGLELPIGDNYKEEVAAFTKGQ